MRISFFVEMIRRLQLEIEALALLLRRFPFHIIYSVEFKLKIVYDCLFDAVHSHNILY